jgi:AcrR family transcriptional regulator
MNATRAAVPMQWVNAPQQARSHKTLERLLDAAEQIIHERGLDALTVPEVVRVARSSVGSFYARFPDKKALLETLHERACAQTVATADLALAPARWEGASAEAIIRAAVVFAVHVFGSRRTIQNAFAEAFAGDPGFTARRAKNAVALGERLNRLLLARRESIGHPHPEKAIPMCLRVVTATLEQRNALEGSGADEVRVSDEELVEELVRMMVRYLDVR